MADVKHRNSIRIATTTQQYEQEAIDTVLSRELLYNRDNKTLGIVLEDENGKHYRQIVSGLVDEVNITKNENFETKLKENIVIDSVTTQADHEGVDWKSQSLMAKTDADNTILLLFKQDVTNSSPAVIGGEILEVGNGIFGHYQISLTQTGSRLIKGATTTDKKAKYVLCIYNGERYYGIKFKSGLAANIYFAGWQSIGESLLAPAYTDYEDRDLSDIVELDDDSDTGTQVVDVPNTELVIFGDRSWEFNERNLPLNNLGNGLTLLQNNASQIFRGNGDGCIFLQDANDGGLREAFSFSVYGNCNITVGWIPTGPSTRTVRIKETFNKDEAAYGTDPNGFGENIRWARTYTVTNQQGNVIESTYPFQGALFYKRNFIIENEGPIYVSYIRIQMNVDLSGFNPYTEIIRQLAPTGEDGSSHIIRLSGEITKAQILQLAQNLKDPSKQITVDLSQCTMVGVTSWSDDADLSKAFQYCVSLRAFYYPKNVTSSGKGTFMYCSFLREVHLNKEMLYLGYGQWHQEYFGLFAGARMKTIFIPKNVIGFHGYTFSDSNIVNCYVEEGSQLTPTNLSAGSNWSSEWYKTKDGFRFILPQTEYYRFRNANVGFGGYVNSYWESNNSDRDLFMNGQDTVRDHSVLWDGYASLDDPEFEIDYTA